VPALAPMSDHRRSVSTGRPGATKVAGPRPPLTVCLFAGGRCGGRGHVAAAETLAHELVHRRVGVVYGGGAQGLMGIVAATVLAHGGRVVGVVPRTVADSEPVVRADLAELHVTESFEQRRQLMLDLSDAVVVLPGGFGTLSEYADVANGGELGLHARPCGLLNVDGYYDGLLAFLERLGCDGFSRRTGMPGTISSADPAELLDLLTSSGAVGGGSP
jgi:uncharacterized protein (TIGR00730 family)